jgi:hypothetical protein
VQISWKSITKKQQEKIKIFKRAGKLRNSSEYWMDQIRGNYFRLSENENLLAKTYRRLTKWYFKI